MIRNPLAIRPWQHVLEPLAGYLLLGERLLSGDAGCASAWNFGPPSGGHLAVRDIVAGLNRHWPAIRFSVDTGGHPHETAELRLNCDKAQRALGWRPVWNVDTMLERTASWYRIFYEKGRLASTADLAAFVDDASRAGNEWARR
ncbi:MAG: hypothetical protein MZW92_08370 [Comamonadaceae bacterium]|nr:hypothetical protein [Comamonadaceae bacterium]